MAFSWVQDNGSQDLDTVTLTGVSAGNLIVIWCKWEDVVGVCSVSDGTSSFQMVTGVSNVSGPCGQWGYLLVANGGNKTYTVTWPALAAYKRIIVFEINYGTDTCNFDQSNIGSGTGNAAQSGNITTTGNVEICLGGYSEYNAQTFSDRLINEAAADGFETVGDNTTAWWKIFAATFSNGHAQVTTTAPKEPFSFPWVCNIIAFKAMASDVRASYAQFPIPKLRESVGRVTPI